MTREPAARPAGADDAALEWGFNPWRERPARAWLALVVSLALAGLLAWGRTEPVLTLGLLLVWLGALAPLLAPLRCRVDAAGVARRGPLGWERRAWSALRRARLGTGGLFVSPFAAPHWLDPYRALFLPLPSAEREATRRALEEALARHGLRG